MSAIAVLAAGFGVVAILVRAARRADVSRRAGHLSTRVGWRVPGRLRGRAQAALAAAGVDLEPEAACELWAGGVAAAGLFAAGLAPALVLPVLLVAVASGPTFVHLARGRGARRYAAALPVALEAVAAELRGGGTVGSGVGALAAGGGLLAADLRRVTARVALGMSFSEAVAAWPDERGVPGVRAAAGALALAAGMGGRAAGALDGLAGSLRDRLDVVAEARALSTQARLSAVVVGAAPIVYLFLSFVVDPRSATTLVGTGTGRTCLALGLGLEASAVWAIRRIVGTAGA